MNKEAMPSPLLVELEAAGLLLLVWRWWRSRQRQRQAAGGLPAAATENSALGLMTELLARQFGAGEAGKRRQERAACMNPLCKRGRALAVPDLPTGVRSRKGPPHAAGRNCPPWGIPGRTLPTHTP